MCMGFREKVGYGRQIVSGAWKRLCSTISVSVNQM